MEDGDHRCLLAAVRVEALLEAGFAGGSGAVLMVTRDRVSPSGDRAIYYIAVGVPEFRASDPVFGYAPDTVGNGFGLKVVSGSDRPIRELSLLSEGWNPLKWAQTNGAPNHQLLFPESLDHYEGVYDGFPTE